MILELLATQFSNLTFEYSSKPLNMYDDHKMLEDMKAVWISNSIPTKGLSSEFFFFKDMIM